MGKFYFSYVESLHCSKWHLEITSMAHEQTVWHINVHMSTKHRKKKSRSSNNEENRAQKLNLTRISVTLRICPEVRHTVEQLPSLIWTEDIKTSYIQYVLTSDRCSWTCWSTFHFEYQDRWCYNFLSFTGNYTIFRHGQTKSPEGCPLSESNRHLIVFPVI